MEKSAYFIKTEIANEEKTLSFSFCGAAQTMPLHSFGPAVRDTYIVHIVLSGKGYYMVDNRKFQLKAYEGFCISPNESTFYQADETDPWTYIWLGFSGTQAKAILERIGISATNQAFSVTQIAPFLKIITSCFKKNEINFSNELYLDSYTYAFLAELMTCGTMIEGTKYQYVKPFICESLDFLYQHFTEPINVNTVAKAIAINQNYLSRIFHEQVGMTIKDYLMTLRINHAADLLARSDLSIHDVAETSGFSDQQGFAKYFKQKKGCTPSDYRQVRHEISGEIEATTLFQELLAEYSTTQ
ncbi:MAG: AraC family ligand binding domain-containing protein [Aerococcus sp.]|nr:AraC family ligand binding domain-containing protein [Aerococcus sp.]